MAVRIATFLLLALPLGGCTTADDPGPAPAPPPESLPYVERWNAACTGMPGQVAEILVAAFARPVPEAAPAPETLQRAADEIAAVVRRPLDAMRPLPPPPQDRAIVADLVAAFDAGLAALAQRPRSIASIGTGLDEDPFGRADRLAIGYGVGRCALSSAGLGGD